MTRGLLLLAVGCAGDGGPVPDSPVAADVAAEDGARLPLVIEPVAGDFDPSAGIEEIDLARIEELQAAVAADAGDADARRGLAIALHGARRKDQAIAHFEKVAELRPDERGLLELALAYNSVSRIADAERTYARLLRLTPGNPLALHNLGAIAAKRGDFEKAIALYRQALEADPDYLLAQYHLANSLERAGLYEEAYGAFARVVELEPSNAAEAALYDDALYRAASLDITMGAHARAAEMLVELLKVNPNHESAHYAYGQVLLQLGRLEEAQREFETHVRLLAEQHPASPVAMGD